MELPMASNLVTQAVDLEFTGTFVWLRALCMASWFPEVYMFPEAYMYPAKPILFPDGGLHVKRICKLLVNVYRRFRS